MKDDDLLSTYSIKPNDCIVCMTTKPKKQIVQQPIQQPEIKEKTKEDKSETNIQQQSDTNPVENKSINQSSGLVLGTQFEETVNQICEMGFPKDEAVRALRAAYNNPERAIE